MMLDEQKSAALAKAAKEIRPQPETSEEAFEMLLEGIKRDQKDMWAVIDIVIDMQGTWPMPEAGWKAFARDVEKYARDL